MVNFLGLYLKTDYRKNVRVVFSVNI